MIPVQDPGRRGYDGCTLSCTHTHTNTERLGNYDWPIHIYIYIYHPILFPSFHTYTYINKFRDERKYLFFFTIEKYVTLIIGPLATVTTNDGFVHRFE